jgi:hypothetical protein
MIYDIIVVVKLLVHHPYSWFNALGRFGTPAAL